MALITFAGVLSADPILVQSTWPFAEVATFTVVEETGTYGKGDWVTTPIPTTRYVHTDTQSALTVFDTLAAGVHVMVTGREHTEMRIVGEREQPVQVVKAVRIGVLIASEQDIVVTASGVDGAWWPADV